MFCINSFLSSVHNSAASEGVEARTSATKSDNVVSV